jgi:hypothetical protein
MKVAMAKALTSDQFVAGIIAVLALQGKKRFVMTGTDIDAKFEAAFADLMQNQVSLGVSPKFSFYVDPMHGDSACLRDTLHAAKQKELISFNNPTLRTFDVKLSDDRAREYLDKSPLPSAFLNQVVITYFSDAC